MTRKAISPLRQRMIDDMTVRRMASHANKGTSSRQEVR